MEIDGHSWIVFEESYISNVCILSPLPGRFRVRNEMGLYLL
jgi:hypothetical protein